MGHTMFLWNAAFYDVIKGEVLLEPGVPWWKYLELRSELAWNAHFLQIPLKGDSAGHQIVYYYTQMVLDALLF
jgi:hypothetical protein